jgi:hypothetical protein
MKRAWSFECKFYNLTLETYILLVEGTKISLNDEYVLPLNSLEESLFRV